MQRFTSLIYSNQPGESTMLDDAIKALRKEFRTKKATRVVQDGNAISVFYHDTEVVRVEPGSVTLKTGGFPTTTTMRRWQEVSDVLGLGLSVRQHKWHCLVSAPGLGRVFDEIIPESSRPGRKYGNGWEKYEDSDGDWTIRIATETPETDVYFPIPELHYSH